MAARTTTSADESAITDVHRSLLDAWNRRDAVAFAALFVDEAHVVGFDGSQMDGRAEIEAVLGRIFSLHPTPPYVAIVRGVDFPTADTAILQAVAGMVPDGSTAVMPEVNAIQSLVAVKRHGFWRISLFQNTPAEFHGRPEAVDALCRELNARIGSPP